MYIVFYTPHRMHSLYLVLFYWRQQVSFLLLLSAEMHMAQSCLGQVSVTTALISIFWFKSVSRPAGSWVFQSSDNIE